MERVSDLTASWLVSHRVESLPLVTLSPHMLSDEQPAPASGGTTPPTITATDAELRSCELTEEPRVGGYVIVVLCVN